MSTPYDMTNSNMSTKYYRTVDLYYKIGSFQNIIASGVQEAFAFR